jgi:tRNA threonylcarbamoyladenosine biosynthesis protein TsaE
MKIVTRSPQETMRFGMKLARHLKKGDIICLKGQLGSGKTILTKGIASGLGISRKEVLSPTFVLIRHYSGTMPLYHFDFYRLPDFREITALGYEEYFYDEGVSVIEWADRLGCLTPQDCLTITLTLGKNDHRTIEVRAQGELHGQLLGALKEAWGK